MKKYVNTFGLVVTLVMLPVLFQNCSRDHKEGSIEQTSLVDILAANESAAKIVLEKNCASCHSPNSGTTSPIEDILDFAALEESGHIEMGYPQNSKVFTWVFDDLMPKNGPPLSDAEKETIRVWLLGENILTDDIADLIGDDIENGTITRGRFSEVSAIMTRSCMGCHDGTPGPAVNLTDFNTLRTFVVPRQPLSSELIIRIRSLNPNAFPIMPQRQAGTPGLPAADIYKIQTWVEDGALNN